MKKKTIHKFIIYKMSDDYFQLYDKDEINLIKSRWRLQSNSMYG